MQETMSQFVRSVCCNAPIKLDFLRPDSHNSYHDMIPIVCVYCKEDIAGAAIDDIQDGYIRRNNAQWDYRKQQFKWRMYAAFENFRRGFFINPS